ncbi:MAG TPA: dihydrodipicolinate synthase family protein [Gammaproteobacteria bacterium]|nr:dihydrodipicolinate synthase family protein [Gammaproteobacteria bacterium]
MANNHRSFAGVNAAVLTPVTDDLAPNDVLMVDYSKWLLANGCDGLAILGTTGEANSFSLKERIRIIENLIVGGVPAEVLMPGTGACSITDAVELTKMAVNAGVGGVLMLPPWYYKNPSDAGLFRFFSEVIQRISDNRLQIYLYHFPQMSATPITYNLIEMLLKAYPNVVTGMKDSSGDLENMAGAAERFPGFEVMAGAENCFYPLLERGGAGCITACSNVTSQLAQDVYQAFNNDADHAVANDPLVAIRKVIQEYPLSSALKEIIARHTGNAGWRNTRPPFTNMDEVTRQKLFKEFDAVGYALPKAA